MRASKRTFYNCYSRLPMSCSKNNRGALPTTTSTTSNSKCSSFKIIRSSCSCVCRFSNSSFWSTCIINCKKFCYSWYSVAKLCNYNRRRPARILRRCSVRSKCSSNHVNFISRICWSWLRSSPPWFYWICWIWKTSCSCSTKCRIVFLKEFYSFYWLSCSSVFSIF